MLFTNQIVNATGGPNNVSC